MKVVKLNIFHSKEIHIRATEKYKEIFSLKKQLSYSSKSFFNFINKYHQCVEQRLEIWSVVHKQQT